MSDFWKKTDPIIQDYFIDLEYTLLDSEIKINTSFKNEKEKSVPK